MPEFGANLALEVASAIAAYAPIMATTSSVDGQDLSYIKIKCALFDVRPDHGEIQKRKADRFVTTLWCSVYRIW